MLDVWSFAAVITKCALYLGVFTAAGTVFAAMALGFEKNRNVAISFAILGGVATVLSFSLSGANLTGDASGMIDPEMLSLLWTTPVGAAFAYRLAGLVLLIFGLFLGRNGLWLSALGGVVALWSFDHVGHVPDRGTGLLDIALTLHLIAIAFWVGILTPLKRLASEPATFAAAADVGHRFGVIASVTVPALIIAGGYMAFTLLGSFGALIGTGYGQTLLLKVVLVSGLLGLAAANKLRFIPRLRAGDPIAATQLVRSISFEWMVILAVFAVTAVLTSSLELPT